MGIKLKTVPFGSQLLLACGAEVVLQPDGCIKLNLALRFLKIVFVRNCLFFIVCRCSSTGSDSYFLLVLIFSTCNISIALLFYLRVASEHMNERSGEGTSHNAASHSWSCTPCQVQA